MIKTVSVFLNIIFEIGYSIVEGPPEIKVLDNFRIHMPNIIQQTALALIASSDDMRTIDLIEKLGAKGFSEYDVDYYNLSRNEKTALLMKLNRNIVDPLTESGYISKIKHGRENSYIVTDSGRYISSLSGIGE